ncbi:hypothetical protein GS534_00825 [Rhodococcus hoagii]|nr:hypothetical protein [Prescottella equi]
MTDIDNLEARLVHEYDCQDIVEFAHYQTVAYETLSELRKANAVIERVHAEVERPGFFTTSILRDRIRAALKGNS